MTRAAALAVLIVTVMPAAARAAPAQLAYVHADRVWTMGADGTGRARVPLPSRAGGHAISYDGVSWTADGSRLLVSYSRTNGPDHLASVAPGGGALSPVVAPPQAAGGVLSPGGDRIAWVHEFEKKDAIVTKLFVARRDGSARRQLARAEFSERRFAFLGEPVWAPDGRSLLYTVQAAAGEGYSAYAIHSVAAGGGHDRVLTHAGQDPAYSPDGTHIAFSSQRDHDGDHQSGEDEQDYDGEIYVMDADGRSPRRLTSRPGDDIDPSWSSDGTRLVFSSDANAPAAFDANLELWTIGADGSCATQLTNGAPASDGGSFRAGDSGSTAPASCGALPPATVDVAVPHVPGPTPFWLGTGFASMLLDSTQREPDGLLLSYEDCGAATPAGCGHSFLLTTGSACSHDVAVDALLDATTPRRVHGALVLPESSRDGGGAFVLTGRQTVAIQDDGGPRGSPALDVDAIVAGLRPVGGTVPAQLAGPALPARLLDDLARVSRTERRLHSVAATARALHRDPERIRERLTEARTLATLGPVARLAC